MDMASNKNPTDKVRAAALLEIGDKFEEDLGKHSTFSSSTIALYADKIRRDGGDPKVIGRIASALKYRREYPNGPRHGDGSSPPDLEFLVEMWQERDRQAYEDTSGTPSDKPASTGSPSSKMQRSSVQTFAALMQESYQQRQLSEARSLGEHRQRYTIVPRPYLPCVIPLDNLERINLLQLTAGDHNRGKAVILRHVGAPIYRRGRTLAAAVDDTGNGIFLELVGIDNMFKGATLSADFKFAIKEPYMTSGRDVETCIRVHHPTDIVSLGELTGSNPNKTCKEWKERGNGMFKAQKYGEAARAYEQGLKVESDEESTKNDLHRNLAQAFLSLGINDRAKSHAETSLVHDAGSHESSASSPCNDASTPQNQQTQRSNDAKAHYRAAIAAYRLRDFTSAELALQAMLKLVPEDKDGKRELLKVYKRLNEEQNAAYDFDNILSKVSTKQPEVDVANFTLRTLKRSSAGKGNGLFAARDFEIGDLVLCEKAFSSDFAVDAKQTILKTFNTSTGIFSHASASLWIKTLQEAIQNPSRASALVLLGGAYEGLGSQNIHADGSTVIDAFQVHDIVTRNCFAIPSPNPQAKTDTWGLYSVQSNADGSTSRSTGNCALFCHTALINHSCLPNVEKRFLGDLILIRAAKPIKKREEILLDYTPATFPDMEEFDMIYERTWQFNCDCKLCEAGRQEDQSVRKRRLELSNEANELGCDLSAKLPMSYKFTAKISRLEKLIDELNATYESKFYRGLPRKSITYALVSLATVYSFQKNHVRLKMAIKEGFGSLGWESPLEAGGKLVPLPAHTAFLDLNIPHLL